MIALISPRPVFIIHGREDKTIAPKDAHALYAAAGEPKEGVWLIDGAGHAEGAEVAAEEYARKGGLSSFPPSFGIVGKEAAKLPGS